MPATRERNQRDDRSQIELIDQHGRLWVAASEVGLDARKRPVISPVGSFDATFSVPFGFLPPQKYLVFDVRRPSQLTIAYDAWITDQRAAHREVAEHISRLAWAIYKDQAPQFIKNPTPEMLEIVYGRGKGPEPVEPVLAAKQGNGWILGLREFDPERAGDVKLKPFLDRWVEVRYRDARPWEDGEEVVPEALQFGDEQELTDAELEELTAPEK